MVTGVIEVTQIPKMQLEDYENWANWIIQMMPVTFNKTADFVLSPCYQFWRLVHGDS